MGMLRAVFFYAMLAVAQSQTLTCLKMSLTLTGGICDGTKTSVGACAPAGTPAQAMPAMDGKNMADGCTLTTASCASLGGTANTAYCAAGGGMPFLSSFDFVAVFVCRLLHMLVGSIIMHQVIDC